MLNTKQKEFLKKLAEKKHKDDSAQKMEELQKKAFILGQEDFYKILNNISHK